LTARLIWLPYCGEAPVPAEWASRWNFDPVLILLLAGAVLVCRRKIEPTSTQRAAFACAFVLAAILFISPLCALSSALFSVRVAHHVVLTTVIAPLLVWSMPSPAWRLGLAPALLIHTAIFWFWHTPAAYSGALSTSSAYWLMQATLLGSASLLWAAIRTAAAPMAVAALLLAMVQMGLLGALLTFSPEALYPPHWHSTTPWGLSPLQDQQLGGLIMWVPGSALYLFCALAMLHRSLAPRQAALRAT
jgi:putative membrane protein